MKTIQGLVAFLLLSSIALAQGAGQTPTAPRPRQEEYVIRGKIIAGSGSDSDVRIEVRLERATMQLLQTAYTDSVGNFEFRNLSPGAHYVTVNVDGFEPVRQVIELYPNMAVGTANIFLTRAPVVRPRLTGVDAADPDIVDVSQMKENFPRKATQNFEKAIDEKRKGQNDKAIKLLEEAIQLAPTFYHAHNNLGVLYQGAKRFADAEKHFLRARQLNAKSSEPLTNLGSLYIEMSDTREGQDAVGRLLDSALDALEDAVKLNPRSAGAYLYLGSANYKSGFYEEADAAYSRALALEPSMTSLRLMLANVYVKQGRWRDVIDNLDAYLKDNPKAKDRAAVEEMRAKIVKGLEATNNK